MIRSITIERQPLMLDEEKRGELGLISPLITPPLPASPTSPKWHVLASDKHTFVPALEGLRGLAVLLTLFCHIIEQPFILREASGSLGVTMFFCLSGWLITGVLLRLQGDAHDDHKQLSTKPRSRLSSYAHLVRFYTDRTVRLLPALTFMIVGMYFLQRFYNESMPLDMLNKYAVLAMFYLTNFASLWPKEHDPGPFGHTWSLANEEQYYILWALMLPLIVKLSMTRRTLVLSVLILVSFVARVSTSMYPGSWFGAHWHYSLLTNFYKMAIGSALRLVPIPPLFRRPGMVWVGLAGIVGLLFAMCGPQPFNYWSPMYGPGWHDIAAASETWIDPLGAVFTAIIIMGLNGGISTSNWLLENHLLRFCGKVSYSWYLWQTALLVFSGWQRNWPAIGDTAIAFMLAMVSTFYIEEPISRIYKQFKSPKPSHAPLKH